MPPQAESFAICRRLLRRSKRKFTDLFSDAQSRSDMVATFLAVLELAKDKKVMVSGDGGDTSIELLSADFGDTVSEEWE